MDEPVPIKKILKPLRHEPLRAAFAIYLLCSLLGSCAIVTNPLQPPRGKQWETFREARHDVYPQQAIDSPILIAEQTIAWAGVVMDSRPIETKFGPAISILVDHHYFDWLEYHGPQAEIFFLSPRGEGQITVLRRTKSLVSTSEALREFPIGSMIAAAGRVIIERIDANTPKPQLLMINGYSVTRNLYRTDVYSYGREGEPVEKVNGSAYWKLFDAKQPQTSVR